MGQIVTKKQLAETPPFRRLWLPVALLTAAILVNLIYLYPEVTIPAPQLNDNVLHLNVLEQMVAAINSGQNPTDFWLGNITLGYPLLHHYQHLAYLPPALLHIISGQTLPLPSLFHWSRYLLLSLFPLSIYWSMRRFGFEPLTAALTGLLASLLSTDTLFGLDFASYVWRGSGLYTQLWGMWLLPPALAQGYLTLRTGRGYAGTVLLLAATLLSHPIFGYIALVTLALLACVPSDPPGEEETKFRHRLPRLLLLLTLTAIATAYFWLPFWLDRPYMNRSIWEATEKYDSYGHTWVLSRLVQGDLFDFGRFPSLTLLAGLGVILCLRRWRDDRYRLPLIITGLWLLLYFGRLTWGVLLNLLPFSADLHLHRFIAGVHLGGLMLMGIGLSWLWQSLWRQTIDNGQRTTNNGQQIRFLPILYGIGAILLTVLLLYPVYRERHGYLVENARWMMDSQTAFKAEAEDLAALVETLQALPPGRVYAGRGGNWGNDYRVGAVPLYALLTSANLDVVGYLYHALSPNADVQVLFDDQHAAHYDLFNIRYVVAPAERTFPAFVKLLHTFGRHHLYAVETSGYFDLVGTTIAFEGVRSDVYPATSAWLTSPLLPAQQHPAVLLSGSLDRPLPRLPLSQAAPLLAQFPPLDRLDRGRIIAQSSGDGTYQAQVEVTQPSTLLLKTAYHPNWQVTVDGHLVEPLMVMPGYLGLPLNDGSHQVDLTYRPRPWRNVLIVIGLITLLLAAALEKFNPVPARLRPVLTRANLSPPAWAVALYRRLAPHLPYLGLVGALTLLAALPLFQFKIMSGHDALEYLPRAVEFYEGLRAGHLFPRWAANLSGGYGQPFFNFNPPLFYYIAALFRALGFSFIAAQNLAIFALLLLAGLGMYTLAAGLFGRHGGLVTAAAYLFAPYLLVTLYVRHALADFAAFAFIPWAVWGLVHFTRTGRAHFLLIGSPAAALILLSSNPVALITYPFLSGLVVMLMGAVRHAGWRRMALVGGRGGWFGGLALGLAAFFWLPALLEREWVQTERLLVGYLNYDNHFVYPAQFLASAWGYGLSWPGPADGMSFGVGPVHWLLIGLTLLTVWFKRRALTLTTKTLLLFALILSGAALFLASTASRFLWPHLPLLPYLEFPWRFLSLVAVSSALLGGVPFLWLKPDQSGLARWLAAGLIGVLLIWGLPKAQPDTFLDVDEAAYSPAAIAAANLSVTTAREYEPIWVETPPPAPAIPLAMLRSGRGTVSGQRLSPMTYELQATITATARIRLNTFYYPGWTLRANGREQPLAYDNPHGLIEFTLPPGAYQLHLSFEPTPLRRWSERLSFLSLSLLLLSVWLFGLHLGACRKSRFGQTSEVFEGDFGTKLFQ